MSGRKAKVVNTTLPLQGTRLVRQMQQLLERLHSAGTERDKAGNRWPFMEQYITLLLLYFSTLPAKVCVACNRFSDGIRHAANWE